MFNLIVVNVGKPWYLPKVVQNRLILSSFQTDVVLRLAPIENFQIIRENLPTEKSAK